MEMEPVNIPIVNDATGIMTEVAVAQTSESRSIEFSLATDPEREYSVTQIMLLTALCGWLAAEYRALAVMGMHFMSYDEYNILVVIVDWDEDNVSEDCGDPDCPKHAAIKNLDAEINSILGRV